VEAIIENGVARDILKSGIATLVPAADPRQEAFSLSGEQVILLKQLYGTESLAERGLI